MPCPRASPEPCGHAWCLLPCSVSPAAFPSIECVALYLLRFNEEEESVCELAYQGAPSCPSMLETPSTMPLQSALFCDLLLQGVPCCPLIPMTALPSSACP